MLYVRANCDTCVLRCEYTSARLFLVEFRFQRESTALCSMTRFMPRLSAVSAALLLVAAIVDVHVLLRLSTTVTSVSYTHLTLPTILLV